MTLDAVSSSGEPAEACPLPSQLWVWIVASSVSALGGGVMQVGLAWAAAGFGGRVTGWVNALATLPTVLLVLVGGAVGDRFGQRRVLLVAACASVVQCAVLLLLLGLQVPLLLLVCVNALAKGALAGLSGPSSTVYARQFVEPALVARAVSASNTAALSISVVAPALGGVVVGAFALEGSVWANLVGFIGVLVVLLTVTPPPTPPPAADKGRLLSDITSGLGHLRHDRRLVALLGSLVVVAGGLLPVTGLGLPLLVRDRGWGAPGLGLIDAAWAGGSLAASLLIARRGPAERPVVPMVVGTLTATAGCVALACSPNLAWAAASAGVMGIGTVAYAGHVSPVFIHLTPAGSLSRYTSVLILAQVLPVFAASPAIGELTQCLGVTRTMGIGAGIVLLAPAILLANRAVRTLHLAGS